MLLVATIFYSLWQRGMNKQLDSNGPELGRTTSNDMQLGLQDIRHRCLVGYAL